MSASLTHITAANSNLKRNHFRIIGIRQLYIFPNYCTFYVKDSVEIEVDR